MTSSVNKSAMITRRRSLEPIWIWAVINIYVIGNIGHLTCHVYGSTVLNNINGKSYILSDSQVDYAHMGTGCAALGGTVAFLDTNADFIALRDQLSVNVSLQNVSMWLNVTQTGSGADTHYFWEMEEVASSLWWDQEPNKQGAGEGIVSCGYAQDSCRPVQMSRYRQGYSPTHNLMDTCCVFSRFFFCEDIDECQDVAICPDHSHCQNLPGSYQCQCDLGYQAAPRQLCEDMDECSNSSSNNCTVKSSCINTAGSYTCNCDSGYQMMGGQCQDVDECNSPGLCLAHSVCANTIGTYDCVCDSGFSKDLNGTCQDVDECTGSENICWGNSACNNTVGSYQCLCHVGYQKLSNDTCQMTLPQPIIKVFSSHLLPLTRGSSVTLTCEGTSSQASDVVFQWTRDNVTIKGNNSSLHWHVLSRQEEGQYQCRVRKHGLLSPFSTSYTLTLLTDQANTSAHSRIQNKCPCRCDFQPPERDRVIQMMASAEGELTLDTSKLSSRRRRGKSVDDHRAYSTVVGSSAVLFLAFVLLCLAICDFIQLGQFVMEIWPRHFSSDSGTSEENK